MTTMTTSPSGPLYLECSRGQALGTWLGAALNTGLIVWCAAFLAIHAAEASPHGLVLIALVAVGLFFGDLITGLVHWVSDTYFDEVQSTRVISIAREHHLYPHHIVGYGFRDYVGYTSWPAALIFGPVLPWVLVRSEPSPLTYGIILVSCIVCIIAFFGSHFHRFAHRTTNSRLVRWMQAAHLALTPQYHAIHHGGTHTTHYCVVNGWANVVCDAIGFWRGLEWVIYKLTGAVPRHNDLEWLARFRIDKSFMHNPVPSLLAWRARARD